MADYWRSMCKRKVILYWLVTEVLKIVDPFLVYRVYKIRRMLGVE